MENTQANHEDSEYKMLNEAQVGGEDRKSFQVDESLIYPVELDLANHTAHNDSHQ